MCDSQTPTIPFPLEIETPRLVLRSPEVEHAPPLVEAIVESRAELLPWMPWAGEEPSLATTTENIHKAIDEYAQQKSFRIHVFDRQTGRIVGSSGYPRVCLDVPSLEIGYWIRTSRTGEGLCTEVVRALAEYAIETLGAQRVEIRCDDRNVRSWRVAERAGFTLEGVLRNDCLDCDGQPRNTRVYSLLPTEWTAGRT